MCADMRNSYLKEDFGFDFNVLTQVMPYLDASKKIHHFITKKRQFLSSLM
jgi:hypothetical protein